VQEVATEEGYAAAVHVSQAGEQITVDVSSPGLDGVTDNDFILAAKVDSLDLADLVKPARRRTQFY
jgi:pterin-4a-carbinolamine dehydratase